jgi:hypothetical protein
LTFSSSPFFLFLNTSRSKRARGAEYCTARHERPNSYSPPTEPKVFRGFNIYLDS